MFQPISHFNASTLSNSAGKSGRECFERNEGAYSSHGCVASDKVHGVHVGSLETFFRNDGFDFSLGGELGSLWIKWVVWAYPVAILGGEFELP
jgi:hypothetical protein